jgi:hypothetical protein
MTPYNPLEFNLRFALLAIRFMLVSCLAYSYTLKMGATSSFKISMIFNGLHGVIFKETELFVTSAVRTSDPTVSDTS